MLTVFTHTATKDAHASRLNTAIQTAMNWKGPEGHQLQAKLAATGDIADALYNEFSTNKNKCTDKQLRPGRHDGTGHLRQDCSPYYSFSSAGNRDKAERLRKKL